MKGHGGKQSLTLSQQLLFLRANPVVNGAGKVRACSLTWQTSVQPTPLARSYLANVAYSLGFAFTSLELKTGIQISESTRLLFHGSTPGFSISKTGSRPMIGRAAADILGPNQKIPETVRSVEQSLGPKTFIYE